MIDHRERAIMDLSLAAPGAAGFFLDRTSQEHPQMGPPDLGFLSECVLLQIEPLFRNTAAVVQMIMENAVHLESCRFFGLGSTVRSRSVEIIRSVLRFRRLGNSLVSVSFGY